MKKLILLFLTALILPIVNAQLDNYNNLSNLEIKFDIASHLDITGSSSGRIEDLKAKLSFFPKSDYRQEILTLNSISNPPSFLNEKENEISFNWDKVSTSTIDFKLESIIITKNKFSEINKKIKFPVTDIPSDLFKYTEPSEFMDVNKEIRSTAESIIDNEEDLYKAVFKIAEWTRKNINYNLSTLTAEVVQKSSWVLDRKEGVCDEITNLFISFLRSQGIPAKFVSGMAYTNINYEWGNHGWAEVYFPGYGWVPFDVTFGQYGWLDPTHIKLKEDVDSGSPSAVYEWKSRHAEVNIAPLETKAMLLNKGIQENSPLLIDLEPLEKEAGPNSYVPLRVKITNTKDFYISSSLILTKAPGYFDSNYLEVLLEPKETRELYFIIKIPDIEDSKYIYTSILEVKDNFGNAVTSLISYSKDYETYALEKAKKIVSLSEERSQKQTFTDLELGCNSDKEVYYENENAIIDCEIKNSGVDKTINLCIKEDCKKINIKNKEMQNVNFSVLMETDSRILITTEDNEKIKYFNLNLKIIKIPKVIITAVDPYSFDYKDEIELRFKVYSEEPAKNIIIKTNLGEIKIENLKDEKEFSVEVKGRRLIKGLKADISYTDIRGTPYQRKQDFYFDVKNIPWYARLFPFIFSRI